MSWLENTIKKIMLWVGYLGVVIIYGGFLYLLLSGKDTRGIPWFFLLSPWICIYFGLSEHEQRSAIRWLLSRFRH